jgi:chromate transporter
MGAPEPAVDRVPFRDALRFWVKLGFVNFGGPTGQIALMHTELVERRRWLRESSFLHALNFAMLLPGPEAHQLAIYAGWLLNGTAGALVAGIFFLLPAFFLMVALSWIYAVHGDVGWVSGVFDGLAWAVVGIVAAALLRIGSRALRHPIQVVLAAIAFLALFVFGVPFPLVVLGAGLVGWVAGRALGPGPDELDAPMPERVQPTLARTSRALALGLAVWLIPLGLVVLAAGTDSVLAEEALFFSVMALVTFGGAYAVLSYVNQAAVLRYGWLTSSEMAVGLSLAETTPGPLILVVVFVGFVAAFRDPGSLAPAGAGVAGALVTAWATFVPSFLFIFLGAPSVERMRGKERLAGALGAITAAVVGVITNLALVFAATVLFDEVDVATPFGHEVPVPVLGSIDPLAVAVAVASFVAIRRFRVNVVWVVLGAGLAGLARALLG